MNVALRRDNGWDLVFYDQGIQSLTSSHMRALWVQAGTWIELRLSVTSPRSSADNRAALEALLGGIKISEKK